MAFLESGSSAFLCYVGDDLYHERIILSWVSASEYVVVSPDLDIFIEQIDAASADLQGLRLGSSDVRLPFGMAGMQVYRFQVRPAGADLTQLLAEGERHAQVERASRGPAAPPGAAARAGPGGVAHVAVPTPLPVAVPPAPGVAAAPPPPCLAGPAGAWVLDEPVDTFVLGQEVPLPPTALDVGGRAFVTVNGEIVSLSRVAPGTDLAAWGLGRQQTLLKGDPRLLPRPRSPTPVAFVADAALVVRGPSVPLRTKGSGTLQDSVNEMYLRSLGGFTAAHDRWLMESRVPAGSRSGHGHRVLCRALTFAMESDGLNIANLSCCEFLNRHDPEKPAFEGSHIYMGEDEEGTGVTVTPALWAHVASEMSKEYAIEKEKRKAREAKAEAKSAAARKNGPRAETAGGGGVRNAVALLRQSMLARDLQGLTWEGVGVSRAARRRSTYRRLALDDANDMVAAFNALYGCERDALRLSFWDLVSIMEVMVAQVLDEDVRKVLTNFEDLILASPDVVSERRGRAPTRPYFDVTLRADKKAYVDFLRRLMDRRLLGVASESLSLVTIFFVAKKNGKQRLALGCRLTNALFARAPTVEIGSSEAMSAVELEPGQELHAASADIEACFYQCGGIGRLSNYFCLPSVPVEVALELGLAVDVCGQEFTGREMVHPCLVVLPMGWSWSFWLVQRIHLEMLRRAAVPDDRIALGAWPLPPLTSGPVELPYSDNINVPGVRAGEVTELRDRVAARFSEEGFSMHEISETSVHSTILGADVGGHPPVTRRTGQKLWLLRGALQWLASGPIVTGRQVEITDPATVLTNNVIDGWAKVAGFPEVPRHVLHKEGWRVVYKGPYRYIEHIGLKEGGAVLWALRRLAKDPSHHQHRHLFLLDNFGGPQSSSDRLPVPTLGPRPKRRRLATAAVAEGLARRPSGLAGRAAPAKRPAARRKPAASAAPRAARARPAAHAPAPPPQLHARLAKALEPNRSRPASAMALSRCELAATADATRVGYRAYSDAFQDMEVRVLQFLDLMLEAVASTFFTYIRPGALRKLQVRQLLAPSRASGQLQCWSLIPAPTQMDAGAPGLTRTGTSDETVIIDHPAWLGERLFGVAARKCGPPRVCLYQLRHGGASGDIQSGRRGRKTVKARENWRTDSSLNRHGKPGAAHQLLNAMTPASRDIGRQMFEVMGSLFERTVAAETIPK
ncbi:unnamed protein product [Prorocentrum cordatum]|uniref:RNA-directed RNA polymerase n=1 Tax=Prorocentrum cordatum TaxID=2364126 RepID=A0ABN9T996_9DINO|nr:unnamed protein product [Polarella glacialis]